MRILYLHQYFVPLDGAGGTRSYEFARRLIRAGHEVRVVTSTAYLPPQYQHITRTTDLEIDGIPLTIIPVKYGNEMPFARRIVAFLQFALLSSSQAMRRRTDLIYATSTPLTIVLPGMLGSLWQRVPMVFEVRDLWPELPIAMGALRNPLLIAAARLLERVAYRYAAHIIALSPGIAEGIAARGIAGSKITVIPNSSDVALFDVPPERGHAVREKLVLTHEQPLIVYAGTFGRINGVAYLVEMAAVMRQIAPDVRFLLVGGGAEREQIIIRAKQAGVYEQNLWIWDAVAKEEMPAVLAAATIATSVFIDLPPMWNNSANKFFDALAAGKPIAINYRGWQAALLEENEAGIVLPATDPTGAAHQLAAWLSDSARVTSAAAAARRLGHEVFDRDLLAAKLEKVLHDVYTQHHPHLSR